MVENAETRTEKGISLARGPALLLGTILLVAGLYFLYKQHNFTPFSNFPDGHPAAGGNVFLGIFGANGWTGMLTAAGGGLLLFGAAQHFLAKTMSLIVGVALGAAAIIALASGNVLGMAAANGWTELGWGAVAAILLFNTMVPRRRRTVVVADETGTGTGSGAVAPRREPVRTPTADAVPADTGATHVASTDRTVEADRVEQDGVAGTTRPADNRAVAAEDANSAYPEEWAAPGATKRDPPR